MNKFASFIKNPKMIVPFIVVAAVTAIVLVVKKPAGDVVEGELVETEE